MCDFEQNDYLADIYKHTMLLRVGIFAIVIYPYISCNAAFSFLEIQIISVD